MDKTIEDKVQQLDILNELVKRERERERREREREREGEREREYMHY